MRQPWIYNFWFDSVFILGVPFLVTGIVLLLPAPFRAADSMTALSWLLLVVAVDVSHVYSTLYRTYLDRETRQQHRVLLYVTPFLVFVACFFLYALGSLAFWRIAAYLAVYHFARQQYGFLRIYSRHENGSAWAKRLDALTVYAATFYPILDWHLTGQKHFNWFIQGDFYYFVSAPLKQAAFYVYISILAIYGAKEAALLWKSRARGAGRAKVAEPIFNIPRNAIIAGTAVSWYVGIVRLDSDLAFTAINVVSHGIPYMALVWIWGKKKYHGAPTPVKVQRHAQALTQANYSAWAFIFRPRYAVLFVLLLVALAFIEEGFWDIFVWQEKEHRTLFNFLYALFGDNRLENAVLKIAVPLLSVPQITHYIIDGFIWKLRGDRYAWRNIVLERAPLR